MPQGLREGPMAEPFIGFQTQNAENAAHMRASAEEAAAQRERADQRLQSALRGIIHS